MLGWLRPHGSRHGNGLAAIAVLFVLIPNAGMATAGRAVPDVIGIYFDTAALTHCAVLPAGQHHAYLIVTDLSDPAGISGWECQILIDGAVTVLDWGVQWSGLNVYPAPGFGVGLPVPMPRQETMVLLDITFLLAGMEPAYFYIQAWFRPSLPDVPSYASATNPGLLRPLHQSTGGPNVPVAVLNGDCTVAGRPATWGEVKALYR